MEFQQGGAPEVMLTARKMASSLSIAEGRLINPQYGRWMQKRKVFAITRVLHCLNLSDPLQLVLWFSLTNFLYRLRSVGRLILSSGSRRVAMKMHGEHWWQIRNWIGWTCVRGFRLIFVWGGYYQDFACGFGSAYCVEGMEKGKLKTCLRYLNFKLCVVASTIFIDLIELLLQVRSTDT